MNEEDRLILKGYELALGTMGERLDDISEVYKVLNESHINTQIQLEGLRKTTDFIRHEQTRLSNTQVECREDIGKLTLRFNDFETSAKTLLSIVKWIVTPAMVFNVLYIIYSLVVGGN